MSFITTALAGLTPPPVFTPEHYDGWQLRWKLFVFRPAELKTEAYLVFGLLIYVAFVFYGASTNSRRAKRWLSAHLPVYEKQFSKPLFKGELIEDGYTDFFAFSTGRRHVESLHTIFKMRPRHDLVQYLFQVGRTFVDLHYRPVDEVQLDFKLSPTALSDAFVWAVVAKDELLSAKEGRWDLTLTKTSENGTLPAPLSIVMSEFADVTENLLKPFGSFSLLTALQDPKILPYFRSLSITDQPRERPEKPIPADKRERHVILTLSVPSSSSAAADTVGLVSAVFQLIDALNKISLRPETKSKLRKSREEIDKHIKEESEKEKKEEEADAKAAAKKRAREEYISKLSAAEQQKELEKEKKRNLRKAQGKATVRK